MDKKHIGLWVVGALVLAGSIAVASGAFSTKAPEPEATVSGTVTYRERIALLPGSVVQVQLQDVSLADAPAIVLAETEIVTEGENVPLPFELTYNPDEITENHTYVVSARITQDGELRWVSDTHTPVITNDAPVSDVEIILVGAGSAGGSSSVATAPKAPVLPKVQLLGTTFRLASHNDKEIPRGTNYTLTFDEGRLSAKFCNTMTGAYTIEHEVIRAPQMIATLMACTGPSNPMGLENAFGKLMTDGAAFMLVGSTLTLASAGGDTMTFTVFMD